MIHKDSRTAEWIAEVASKYKVSDAALVEKAIRAFSLLEALVRSGCPLLFKGGTSLMLHLDSAKRLSIDIDIICPPETKIEDYLEKYSAEYGFGEVKLLERIARTDMPKQHAKYYYKVSYPSGRDKDAILLDVLFEEIHYTNVVSLPIQSRFLKNDGEPIMVNVPSVEDLLGDKLTAFAPHTTGIPFFKGERNCSMEINKQLFDIASLFDLVDNVYVTSKAFRKFSALELEYRHLPIDADSVLDDIYNTSLCIVLRGQENPDEFELLQDGIMRVRSFIHSEKYNIESAITNASKAAYLSRLIKCNKTELQHFDSSAIAYLAKAEIVAPLNTKLNKLKKTNIEAFYYWNEIQKMTICHAANDFLK